MLSKILLFKITIASTRWLLFHCNYSRQAAVTSHNSEIPTICEVANVYIRIATSCTNASSVLGKEINSCLSCLTFINTQLLQRPILAWAINYSWLGFASSSSPMYDLCTVVINGNISPGQHPKRLDKSSNLFKGLLLPSSCKSPRNRCSWNLYLLWPFETFLFFYPNQCRLSIGSSGAVNPH